jgi:hypothetical protein
MIKMHQRELHAYISEIFERSDVRTRSPRLCFTPVVKIDVRAMNFENASPQ